MSGSNSVRVAREENRDPHRKAFAVRVGKVVRVNHKDHSVDAVLVDGGMVFSAKLLETWAGSDHGDSWTPEFTPDPGVSRLGLPAEAFRIAPQQKRDTYCLIAFADGKLPNAFVLGFFFPEVSQMMVDGFQRITRYVGDSFQAVSKNGDHWLAFDQTGGFIALHDAANAGRPPDLSQTDYDQRLQTARPIKSISLMTANGAAVTLDGVSGNVRVTATQHLELEATKHLDIYATTIAARGFEDIWLGRGAALVAGQCLAPFVEDTTKLALNLCVNCAYDRRLTMREASGVPEVEAAQSTGWRFLADGDAGRVEIGPDGRLRFYRAEGGLMHAAITWDYPDPHYQNYFVDLNFPTPGIQRFVVPPGRFRVTGIQTANAAAWTSSIGNPTPQNPADLAAGTVVTVEVTAVSGLEGAQISLWGNRG